MKQFVSDSSAILAVVENRRPSRLPIYEHIISPLIIDQILGVRAAQLFEGGSEDLAEYFRHYVRFFQLMTYDCVSFEVCISEVLPGHGALLGGKGPIQTREDFERYPWSEVPDLYWRRAAPLFDALIRSLPPHLKVIGGVGNGVFELSEDLVGMEFLPFMQADDPQLSGELYRRIGDLMAGIWGEFLRRYGEHFIVCRFGDDLGFRSSLLTTPSTIRDHIFPQYRRIIDLVHRRGRHFLWHSCGCIFRIMDEVIALGIDAKHSNEDVIAPFDKWIDLYGDRIGLLGGFDMDFLCRNSPAEIRAAVADQGGRFRAKAKGYALGSGNSIPEYVPVDNYLAMVEGAQILRESEAR